MTIASVGKDKCTGCSACVNVCPVSAIRMQADEEGFLFPQVGENCVGCGKCRNVCPVVFPPAVKKILPRYYAIMGEDDLRLKSSSGGMMSLLAHVVLEEGGCVCGAAWSENSEDFARVEHVLIERAEDLQKIRKSKYVQSNMNDVYRRIAEIMEQGRPVLFAGCPCQVAGMRNYFRGKDERLLLVDIVCHGVPSPLALRRYLEEKRSIGTIERVDFRDKSHGWGTPIDIFYENGYVFHEVCSVDPYYVAFLGGLSTRHSCSTCRYASMQRIGDVTLGDFWGVEAIGEQWNDNKGTGLVIVNSAKGLSAFRRAVRGAMYEGRVWGRTVERIARTRNGQLLAPKREHPAHERFFRLLKSKTFTEAFEYATKKKYDVGIIGWWANLNYGGTLTYFALYSALQAMGLEPLMIEPPRESGTPVQDTVPRNFARKHYAISQVYTRKALARLNDHCRAFISGSDQLWNHTLEVYSGPEYFLSFVNDDRIKLSYASSFGNQLTAPQEYIDRYAPLMRRMQGISVREDYAVEVCKKVYGVDAIHVCDPVFLCDRSVYESAIVGATEEYPSAFLLNFLLDPDASKREVILNGMRALQCSCVNFTDLQNIPERVAALDLENTYPNSAMENLLKAYRDAKFVLTDSFHGTCLAVIFNKPFISIANRARGAMRFESLLRWLGLEDRLVYDLAEIEARDLFAKKIDYVPVNAVIEQTRARSMNWLKEHLQGGRTDRG